ncbi:MAG: hypothetical protein SFW35_10675 [Chitinophagales bacterium]|nr:hypothetical protein [Chitinophagales bacterium]
MKKGLMVLAVVAIAATGFVGFTYAGEEKTSYDIEYNVNCASCKVTYRNEKGESKEVNNVKGNWSQKLKANAGQFVYVSASNDEGTSVKVEIKDNGKKLIEGTSTTRDYTARAGVIL